MINVILIITNLATGGAETMLLKLLQKIDRSRFALTVISLMGIGEVGPRIRVLGIPVHALGMKRGGLPSPVSIWMLLELMRELRPDVVHTWMYHSDLLGGVAARLLGCKRVIWGIRHSNLSPAENKRSTLWVVKLCAALSNVVPAYILSCSYRSSQVHAAVGYATDKLHVIPNGFDLDQFFPDASARDSVRAELGLAEDALLVGLVARYDSQKNHGGFVEAAAFLHALMPQVQFVLVGQGIDHCNTVLVDAIKQKGLQQHIHLLGLRTDIPRLMASFDVLASSSIGEAFPNVLGEAMACGVPCAVTDVGDSAEIVGNTGRVVRSRDMSGLASALFELLSLPFAQRSALGHQARMRISEVYDIRHVTDLYMAFYERVIAEKS